jgi:transglutaminase-like putative cysteine protease
VRRLQWLSLALLAVPMPGLDIGMPLSWAAIALALVTGLKLLEARRSGELRLTSLLLLLVGGVEAALLPGLGPSLLQAAAALLALAALLLLELGAGLGVRQLLGQSLRLVAAALPLVLVLFLLLPRFGPIWNVPFGQTARTGLSDSMDPGSIARLVATNQPAARVSFAGSALPPPAERYWRVLTLEVFDGRRWSRPETGARGEGGEVEAAGSSQAPPPAGASMEHLWLVEPSALPFLPWSGRGVPMERALGVGSDGTLRNDRPPIERRGYALTATTAPSLWEREPPGPWSRRYPAGANPRLEALGRGWAERGLAPAERLQAAERWFRGQPFRYTTEPGPLPKTAGLDTFLFEARSGFCEHYASAFTALMRAAGLPARVVMGYLGGEWVAQVGGGGYLDVRQSDAHAWSEVWLPERGWQRVDPSGWVAPVRISGGQAGRQRQRIRQGDPLGWLVQQWRGLDLRWTGWVLGFNRQAQEALLERLLGGRRDWLGALILAGIAASLAVVLPLLRWSQSRPAGDPLRRELERCLQQLRRLGLEPLPGEELGKFCGRAAGTLPELRDALEAMARSYLEDRYSPAVSADRQRLLRRELRGARRLLGRQARRRCRPEMIATRPEAR